MKPRAQVTRNRVARLARGERTRRDARGLVEELGAARRDQVYRTDVEFTPSDEPAYEFDGKWGSSKRWIEPIRELYAQGLSQLEISNQLGISQGYVSAIARKNGIVKKREGDS